ncbi:MAG: VWA domain-containing protein [Gemmatimonadaceae bacterium]|nr:VWA domain-containing protein [Gemmatimonadaceae bacterium]
MNNLPPLLFDEPWLLLLALILPLVVWALRRMQWRRHDARLARFADSAALPRLVMVDPSPERRRTWRLMMVAALVGVALSGPRWGLARGPVSSRGIDMALALDASLSMMAPDERPSRLERMKQEVRRLRAMSQADRIALIAFAGRSYILTPLTNDDGALELFLDNLDPSVVGQAGSSLARAITQGTEVLLASDGSADRALVIMSDGESFDDPTEVERVAAEAGSNGVSIVTVGFGTTQGSTIPIRDGSVVKQKTDDEGNIVVTRYMPQLLEQAATASNGTFIPAEASDKATRIRGALRSLRTARREVNTREDHVPRFLWVLAPAMLLLAWDSWRLLRPQRSSSSARYRVPMRGQAPQSLIMLVAISLPGMLSCRRTPDPAALFANGQVASAVAAYRQLIAQGDTTQRTAYNLGSALIALDSLNESSERLESVRQQTSGELQFRARFNAGLAALRLGRAAPANEADRYLAAARAAYRDALMDRPGHADAKWNYELALRKNPPQGGGGGGGGGGDQQSPPEPQNEAGLDQRQAEALLNSAAREERDVQGKKQRQGRTPPGGKDW